MEKAAVTQLLMFLFDFWSALHNVSHNDNLVHDLLLSNICWRAVIHTLALFLCWLRLQLA